jgi:putative Mn2+ efflux pump MntP
VTPLVLALGVFTTVMMIAGMYIGSQLFKLASERTYRLVGYIIVAISAIIALPLLDPLFQR